LERAFFATSFSERTRKKGKLFMSHAFTSDFDRMHSLDEFCDLIGCKKTKVYDLIKSGKLRAFKIDGTTRIYRSEIDRFIAASARPLVLSSRRPQPGSFGRANDHP
jgi:excisionase family DNA binding protein